MMYQVLPALQPRKEGLKKKCIQKGRGKISFRYRVKKRRQEFWEDKKKGVLEEKKKSRGKSLEFPSRVTIYSRFEEIVFSLCIEKALFTAPEKF